MKKIALIALLIVSTFSVAQNNHIVKTEDGRRVLLKADFTWEYIDAEKAKNISDEASVASKKERKKCSVSKDFVEPKLNRKIQGELKKNRATMSHIKKKVAKNHNCSVSDVLLLFISETKQKGRYDFCVNGSKITYKRVGSSIIQKGKYF